MGFWDRLRYVIMHEPSPTLPPQGSRHKMGLARTSDDMRAESCVHENYPRVVFNPVIDDKFSSVAVRRVVYSHPDTGYLGHVKRQCEKRKIRARF